MAGETDSGNTLPRGVIPLQKKLQQKEHTPRGEILRLGYYRSLLPRREATLLPLRHYGAHSQEGRLYYLDVQPYVLELHWLISNI